MIADTRRHCPACDREYDTVEHPRPGCPKCLPSRPFFALAVSQSADCQFLNIRREIIRALSIPPERLK